MNRFSPFNHPHEDDITWHLEIRDNNGGVESTDTFVGTEQEALADAKRWLAEALTLDTYQKEILVICIETEECIYQGDFGLTPKAKER